MKIITLNAERFIPLGIENFKASHFMVIDSTYCKNGQLNSMVNDYLGKAHTWR
jgi:hypothetical protein